MTRSHQGFSPEQICLIGEGIAGLSAAYDLGRWGHDVLIIETGNELGGFASSLMIGGGPIERLYHLICKGDNDLIDFIEELGIQKRAGFNQNGL